MSEENNTVSTVDGHLIEVVRQLELLRKEISNNNSLLIEAVTKNNKTQETTQKKKRKREEDTTSSQTEKKKKTNTNTNTNTNDNNESETGKKKRGKRAVEYDNPDKHGFTLVSSAKEVLDKEQRSDFKSYDRRNLFCYLEDKSDNYEFMYLTEEDEYRPVPKALVPTIFGKVHVGNGVFEKVKPAIVHSFGNRFATKKGNIRPFYPDSYYIHKFNEKPDESKKAESFKLVFKKPE